MFLLLLESQRRNWFVTLVWRQVHFKRGLVLPLHLATNLWTKSADWTTLTSSNCKDVNCSMSTSLTMCQEPSWLKCKMQEAGTFGGRSAAIITIIIINQTRPISQESSQKHMAVSKMRCGPQGRCLKTVTKKGSESTWNVKRAAKFCIRHSTHTHTNRVMLLGNAVKALTCLKVSTVNPELFSRLRFNFSPWPRSAVCATPTRPLGDSLSLWNIALKTCGWGKKKSFRMAGLRETKRTESTHSPRWR